jgi:histidyl-tRNA synthetase
LGYYKK